MKKEAFPKRLIDSAPDELTRELLEGAREEAPPPDRASAWLDRAVLASATSAVGSAGGGRSMSAWHKIASVKGLLSVVGLASLGVAGAIVLAQQSAPHNATSDAPAVASPLPSAPSAPASSNASSNASSIAEPPVPSIAVTDLPVVPPLRVPSAHAASSARPGASTDVPSLGPELDRLRAARALLHAGDSEGAIAAVADYERSFPNGAFWPEAEAIAIDALIALGPARSSDARARAQRFMRLYGDSPQAGRFKSVAGM